MNREQINTELLINLNASLLLSNILVSNTCSLSNAEKKSALEKAAELLNANNNLVDVHKSLMSKEDSDA